MPSFLHVGCGPERGSATTIGMRHPDWEEIRLDIDPASEPDIVASLVDMSAVADASVDALYSSHNIEHLYAHEVPTALAEFKRVLKPDGFAIITCPDLQSVAELVVDDKLTEEVAPGSMVAAIDIIYGYRMAVADGQTYMAHHCGFTAKVLSLSLMMARFGGRRVAQRKTPHFDLWAVATPAVSNAQRLDRLERLYLPTSDEFQKASE